MEGLEHLGRPPGTTCHDPLLWSLRTGRALFLTTFGHVWPRSSPRLVPAVELRSTVLNSFLSAVLE